MDLRKIFYKGNKPLYALFILLTILDSLINLVLAYILQQITDAAVGTELTRLMDLCFISMGAFFNIAVMSIALYHVKSCFKKKAMQQYKQCILNGLLKKGRKSFSKEGTSTYLSALTNDASIIETNYIEGTVELISYIFFLIAAIIMMLWYNPILALLSLLLLMLPVAISMLTSGKLESQEKLVSQCNAEFVGSVKDMLDGYQIIKSFRAEGEIQKLYHHNNERLEKIKYHRNIICGRIGFISVTGGVISQIAIFLAGAYLAITGKGVTAGMLIAFVDLLGQIVVPIGKIPQLFANRKAAAALIDKMDKALAINIDNRLGKNIVALEKSINLSHVSFGYDDTYVLNDININLCAGKSYAIVGASGSGKSTLLDAIMGSYDNYIGEINYDGIELQKIDSDAIYELVSVVQQNVFIFDASILDNITMFREFPIESVKRAIELSGLAQFIEDKGCDYVCGENGCYLSGGEKQRISIARCLLRHSSILVADEATSALDRQTEYSIISGILKMKNITRIIVTHQLDERLLSQYDKLLVMKSGKIVEEGTFEELLDRKQYFYSLYNVVV